MPISTRQNIYIKRGRGFYVSYNPDKPKKPIKGLGYIRSGRTYSKWTILEPDPEFSFDYSSDFFVLLITIFNEGLRVSGRNTKFNLTDDFVENGLIDFSTWTGRRPNRWKDLFKDIPVLDFMSLLGAVNYDVTPHLATTDNPTPDPRPLVTEVPQRSRKNMLSVIKYLGLWGYLHHLYIQKGLTWEEFKSCIFSFFPLKEDREEYISKINYVLRFHNIMLGYDELKELGLEE